MILKTQHKNVYGKKNYVNNNDITEDETDDVSSSSLVASANSSSNSNSNSNINNANANANANSQRKSKKNKCKSNVTYSTVVKNIYYKKIEI